MSMRGKIYSYTPKEQMIKWKSSFYFAWETEDSWWP